MKEYTNNGRVFDSIQNLRHKTSCIYKKRCYQILNKSDPSSLSKWTAPMKGNLGKSKHI